MLIGLRGKIECHNLKNMHFENRKKNLHFLTTFHDFVLKVETGEVTSIATPFLKIGNSTGMMQTDNHSFIKNVPTDENYILRIILNSVFHAK